MNLGVMLGSLFSSQGVISNTPYGFGPTIPLLLDFLFPIEQLS